MTTTTVESLGSEQLRELICRGSNHANRYDTSNADDFVQESIMKIMVAGRKGKIKTNLEGCFQEEIRHQAMNHFRKNKRRDTINSSRYDNTSLKSVESSEPHVSVPLIKSEERQQVVDLLNRLTPRERQIITMMLDDLTSDKIIETLKITPSALHRHASSARVKLRKLVATRVNKKAA